MENNDFINVKDVAELLKISVYQVYHLTATRQIPHYKPGKKIFFLKSELIEWIKQSRVATMNELDTKAKNYARKGAP